MLVLSIRAAVQPGSRGCFANAACGRSLHRCRSGSSFAIPGFCLDLKRAFGHQWLAELPLILCRSLMFRICAGRTRFIEKAKGLWRPCEVCFVASIAKSTQSGMSVFRLKQVRHSAWSEKAHAENQLWRFPYWRFNLSIAAKSFSITDVSTAFRESSSGPCAATCACSFKIPSRCSIAA